MIIIARKEYLNTILTLIIFVLLVGCKSNSTDQSHKEFEEWHKGFSSIPLSHAKGFTIEQKDNQKLLTIVNPWNNTVTARYLLYQGEKPHTPSSVTPIKIPIDRSGVTSCTQIGFLNTLNELKQIIGICYPERVYNEPIRQAIQQETIADLGDPFNLNTEKVLSINPTILWVSGYAESDQYYQRIQKSGQQIVYINEWMEEDVLARAEWIRFVAAFFDKDTQADQYYHSIATQYNQLVDTLRTLPNKPKILSGENFRGSWYMPSSNNWLAKLYTDAAGDYQLPHKKTKGSVSLTLEEALNHFSNADIWMGVDARSLQQLAQTESRYRLFRPFKTGKIYHFSHRATATGGNDYWEQAVVEPHVLLKDFAAVFHPQRYPFYKPKYIEQLNP